jgi:hypothetical protein
MRSMGDVGLWYVYTSFALGVVSDRDCRGKSGSGWEGVAVAVGVVEVFVSPDEDGSEDEVQSRERSRRRYGGICPSFCPAGRSIVASVSNINTSPRRTRFRNAPSSPAS